MAERNGASHQAVRYLPYQVDENPEKHTARYGTVEQDGQGEPFARASRPMAQQDSSYGKAAVIEEYEALHVITTPRYSSNEHSLEYPASSGRGNYYSDYHASGHEVPEHEELARKDLEKRPFTAPHTASGDTPSRSATQGAKQTQQGRQASRQRGRDSRKQKTSSQSRRSHVRGSSTYRSGRHLRRAIRYHPTRNLGQILRDAVTEPMVSAAKDRPELQQTTSYTKTAIRSAGFVSRWISRVTRRSLRLVLSVKFVLPLLLALVLAVALPSSILAANTLDSDSSALSDTYEYITKLDAITEQAILNSAHEHGADLIYINGAEVSLAQLRIQTNIDYLLMYLQTRYGTANLDQHIVGDFGGDNVRAEIKALHDGLYVWRIKSQGVSPTSAAVSVVQLTTQPVASYVAAHSPLAEDEVERVQLMSSLGTYLASSAIGDPFDGHYYIKDRWGWYVADNGSLAERQGLTLLPYDSTFVYSCCPGSVIEVSGDRISVRAGEDVIRYSNLRNVSVSVGQSVQQGQLLGAVSYSSGLYLEYYHAQKAINPLFLLPSREIALGDGSALVAVAAEQLGNVGGQPYWSWYGFGSRVDWCACFVSWCADQAGLLDTAIPKYSVVGTGASWFRARGQWQNGGVCIPQPGYVIFFDWDCDGVLDHTGIVESCDGITVNTIEGNSGPHPGSCLRKSYSIYSTQISGYGISAQ